MRSRAIKAGHASSGRLVTTPAAMRLRAPSRNRRWVALICAGESSTYNKRESSGVGIFCAEASFRTEMLLLFVLKSEIVAFFEITMIKACVAFLCLYLCATGILSLLF